MYIFFIKYKRYMTEYKSLLYLVLWFQDGDASTVYSRSLSEEIWGVRKKCCHYMWNKKAVFCPTLYLFSAWKFANVIVAFGCVRKKQFDLWSISIQYYNIVFLFIDFWMQNDSIYFIIQMLLEHFRFQ